MKYYIGITDTNWFEYLRYRQPDEVNFWVPGGRSRFRALSEGELFLFKLHSPHDYIVGGGIFVYSNILPVSLAWRAFGENNGASSLTEMRRMIENYRGVEPTYTDYNIGCIILAQPFFWAQDQWLSIPSDWSRNIVQGKTYDTSRAIGQRLWDDVQMRLAGRLEFVREGGVGEGKERYGSETTYRPRLGQGGFRVIVTDAYRRRCAVTQERVLPTLEAAHIKPYAESGPHAIGNGVLLRSDLHLLLDAGYITISTDYYLEVSKRIKEDFDNGEEYRQLHGSRLYLPSRTTDYPSREFIQWHNEKRFRI